MSRAFATGLLTLVVATSAGAQTGVSTDVHALDIDLGNLENRIRLLERDVENPVARSRFYSLEKRIVDARVYFELKNYAKAAVLYMDAVANPAFQGSSQKADILLRLGFSLYKLKNYLAAREYLEDCAAIASGSSYDKALRYLVEIGLGTRSEKGLEKAVRRVSKVRNRSPATQYSFAKGLYRLGRTQEAIEALGAVPASSTQWSAARYYTAVILTERKKYKEAIAAFTQVVQGKGDDVRTAKVKELAWLGQGRLYLEMEEFSRAIDAYGHIPRNSINFHTALYEMTWAFVHGEQYDKALNSLEVLLLTVEDEQLATQANILRGRLNILLDRSDEAVTTYNEIVERFSPLREELDGFARKSENLAAYFRWLLQRRTDAFGLGSVVSERASNWIERDAQLGEVVGLFDDMAFQRKDVGEAETILEEIEGALKAANRVEIFPNLKHSWTRIIVAENALIELSQTALNVEGRLARATMSAEERQQLESMLAKRSSLEKEFESTPKTIEAFRQRKNTVQRRYADLKRESFLLESSLKEVRTDLRAMEKWLNEARYSAGKKMNPKQLRAMTRLLQAEKAKLRGLYGELSKLTTQIGDQNARIGAGDAVSAKEGRLRRELLDAHRSEEKLLNGVLKRLVGGQRDQAEQIRTIRARIVDDFTRLGRLLGRIDTAVEQKVAEYRGKLSQERRLLAIYRREVNAFDQESTRIAKDIGQPLFRRAHKRLTDVVLEADLGLVDVAWKRKNAEGEKILALQKEQTEQLKNLEQTMKSILRD